MQHSRTNHIGIRHHFLIDHAQKGDITLEFVSTKYQLADIFTKHLSEEKFVDIRRQLGVISLWSNVCLMNSWLIYLLIAWISCHMHHIDIYLDNGQFQPKIKILLTLGIKNWGFQLKRVGRGSKNEKMHRSWKVKLLTALTRQSTRPRPIDQFIGIGVLNSLPCFIFSPISSGSSRALSIQLSMSDF